LILPELAQISGESRGQKIAQRIGGIRRATSSGLGEPEVPSRELRRRTGKGVTVRKIRWGCRREVQMHCNKFSVAAQKPPCNFRKQLKNREFFFGIFGAGTAA
jgi:hypothetical protein